MTYAAKSVLWIISGPIVSIVLGYAAFMFFVFAVGAGIDIDDIGTPTEKFFETLALPALNIIAVGGSILSIVVGIRYAFAQRALISDSFPNPLQQSNSRRTKQGEQDVTPNA